MLTWLFSWQSKLRVQVGAVFCIYSAFILLSASAHTIQPNA